MCANFRAFLDHNDGQGVVELHEPTCRREPGRASANDDDIEFH